LRRNVYSEVEGPLSQPGLIASPFISENKEDMKMIAKIRSLTLSVFIGLALASCNLNTSTPDQKQLTVMQANSSGAQAAVIQLTVQAANSGPFTTVGQVINFNYSIKNAGSVGVAGAVTITGATATCPGLNTIGNLDNSLDPGETLVCTSAYSITQADLDKGSVTFVATAIVNGISSSPVTTTIPVVQPRALTLTASANPTTYNQIGQQITFTYVIKNSGSLSLGPAQFTVSDSLIGTTPFNCGPANTTLAPNTTVTCTATYTITQADMNAVSVTNIATASGGGAGPSQSASATVNKTSGASSSLTPGSTIQHTVIAGEWLWQIARCYGTDPNKMIQANTQLSDPGRITRDMVLTVPNIGSVGTIYGPPCVVTHTVKSGDTWSSIAQLYNADPIILQLANSNTLAVGDVLVVPRNSASGSVVPPPQTRALTLTVTANPLTYEQAGQTITFTYTIKNSGNVSLGPAQFTVSDSLIASTPFNCGPANTTLASNAAVTCTAAYTITQADMNAVSITNIATASGGGVGPSSSASATVNKGVKALTLTTAASPLTYEQAGQTITFTYTIRNSGTATLGPSQFLVSDTLINAVPFNCGASDTSLAPGATVSCNASYTISPADMNAASVTSIATASGGGAGASQPASVTINKAVRSLALTVAANPTTYNQAGQQITFTYTIKNSGNVSLGPAQFTISDNLIGSAPFNCGAANATLAPNATVTCTATYTITQTDLTAVSVTNIATASGGGAAPSPSASSTIIKQ
jgi:uncharacterized repeat protein (TIGR01451 family)